ncbi:MAG: cysteine--tRNA ligase [Armatimonadota bacterium]|nr:cysteine--tRNA ligase [Armatimonadota bacterium]MCX7777416.1 cysteine--tRNA ligase [Armatimonadota bacterium]MDW8025085.1 cysteine--tRNA ligase [Armatimonadota bacterium]
MGDIFIYNTLTQSKERFVTREQNKVYMYVCGITPYDALHVGHARTFTVFDVMRRYLEYRGYEVFHVQNITDIDDKIINRASELNISPGELVQRQIAEAEEDLCALGLLKPHVEPRVTEHIPEIIEMVSTLIEKGYAYQVDGDIYFDVSKFQRYGQLSKQDLSSLIAGARVEVDERLKNPLDFALWKAAKPGEPCWDSPWGKGRPGWHIECSAMSLKYLGSGFDIHGGALDLVFPHHENEIAQSEAYTGQSPFVRYWVHSGLVTVGGKKMAKSLGNFIRLRDALNEHGKDALRLAFLSVHYRSPMDYTDERIRQAKAALERISAFLATANSLMRHPAIGETKDELLAKLVSERERFVLSFHEAMEDDFNTAQAIGELFEFVKAANTLLVELLASPSNAAREEVARCVASLSEALRILGIDVQPAAAGFGEVERLIELLIDVRQRLRQKRDYELADMIRERMKELGIILEDTPAGTRWRRAT